MPLCAPPAKLCPDSKAHTSTQNPGDCWGLLRSRTHVGPHLDWELLRLHAHVGPPLDWELLRSHAHVGPPLDDGPFLLMASAWAQIADATGNTSFAWVGKKGVKGRVKYRRV